MYKPPQPTRHFFRRLLQITALCAVLLALFGLAVIAPAPRGLQAQVAEKTVAPPPLTTQIVRLQYANAQDVLNVVHNILEDQDLRVGADSNTNSLIIRGSETALEEVLHLIREIDQPSVNKPVSDGTAGGGLGGGGGRSGGAANFYGFTGRVPNVPGGGARSAGGFDGTTGFGAVQIPGNYGVAGTGGFANGAQSFGYGQNTAFYAPGGSTPESQAIAAEVGNLEQQTATLIHDYRANKDSLDSAARERITTQIRQLVEQAFDKRLSMQELEVAQLEKRLAKVKNSMGRRKELRDRIVNKRVDDLISDDELRWDSANATGGSPIGANAPNAFNPYFFGTGPATTGTTSSTDTGGATAPATTVPATGATPATNDRPPQ
jgi:hypothetical protein